MIVENPLNQNRMLKGPQAFELGIADAMFEPADFLERVAGAGRPRSCAARSSSSAPRSTGRGAGTRPLAEAKGIVDSEGARRPGPYRALELIALAGPRPRRGLRRRGRGAGRPGHERRAARRAVRVRPRAARQAPGRRAGQGARPPGHQGRRRRRRSDGQPARAAVRAAARGAGRDDRPRPGARGQGRRLRARRDRQAARQGRVNPDKANRLKALVTGSPTRTPSPTPTSSSRPSSRR